MQGLHHYQPKLFVQIDLDSLIPQNHILKKIDKILDLSFVRELTSKYYCQNNGRPSIDPELFFRIILVGYIFNISSDRKLCEELRYNLAYRWYCKLEIDDFIPDHSSLSRIRDRYDTTVFEKFFDSVVDLCKKHGLVKGERIITDGTLIEADASLDSMVNRDPNQVEVVHTREDMTSPIQSRKVSNKTHISKTDPDSSLAKKEGKSRALRYKVHTSIDAESRVILDNNVTTGSSHETQVYLDRISYIKHKYKISISEAIADRGYGAADNIQALQSQDIKTYIPLFSTNSGKSIELESNGFSFDEKNDRYICSQGKFLLPKLIYPHGVTYKSATSDCKNCPAQDACKGVIRKSSKYIRHIFRGKNQQFFKTEQKRMQEKEFQEALRERMWKIEGINAEAKNYHGLKRARYRGLRKVQIQANMVGTVQNLKRLISFLNVLPGQIISTILIKIAIFLKSDAKCKKHLMDIVSRTITHKFIKKSELRMKHGFFNRPERLCDRRF